MFLLLPFLFFFHDPISVSRSASDEICDDKLLKGLAEPNEELVSNMKTGNPVSVLRQICNHPYLACCSCIPGTKTMLVNENIVQRSGKMQVLDAMLTRLKKNGHKVCLVVSCV